jgi:sigma-E factor negative regulatory protein RseA
MNEELDSQLSAMFDDELAAGECELLARRLSRDEQLKARWGRYAVIGAAIRSERGVRLNAHVASRVSVVVRAEPALAAGVVSRSAGTRWLKPLLGTALVAGVAALSILVLRVQAPEGGASVVTPPTARNVQPPAAPASHAGSAATVATTAAPSYVVPPAQRANGASVPPAELANYVVAHSMYSAPVARGTLLSSFITSEPAAAGAATPVSTEVMTDPPPRDAPSQPQ